ncbi:MAG: ABC transporter permease [Gemmatimonadota bacterium]|jgi:predicted permease
MPDVNLALRTLARSPFLTVVAILSLALGIGANAGIFSLFDQILLRSLPVEEPDRLVNFKALGPNPGSQSCNSAGGCDEIFSYPMLRDLQRGETGFQSIAGHRLIGANLSHSALTTDGSAVLVTGNYFETLGVRPALGRVLSPFDDEEIGASYVAVLSWDYWQTELGGDPGVLNSTLLVNGRPFTVVGVSQRGFEGTTLGGEPDAFVPITMLKEVLPDWWSFEDRRNYWVYAFGRLAPGLDMEQAGERINGLYSSIINEVEVPLQEGMTEQTMERFKAKQVGLEPGNRGQSNMHRDAGTPLYMLLSITAFVLLIACANVANLLLARGAQRGQEMAIRSSLGASRGQLLLQLLTESVLLASLGGVASLAVAQGTLRLMAALLPPDATAMITFSLDRTAVLFAAALSLGTGFLFGFYPALHNTRLDLNTRLKASSGQPSGSRAAQRFRNGLVTAQIALSLALLAAAGLFLESLRNVSRVELGIRTDHMVTFAVSPVLNGYEPEVRSALFQDIERELAALPGVQQASASMVPVLAGSSWGTAVSVEGFQWEPGVDAGSRYTMVGPGFFSTMGMALLAGREFTESDGEGAPEVAVVNEAFTRKFDLDGRAVGKFMARGDNEDTLNVQIVGVVRDAAYSDVKNGVQPVLYLPYRQDPGVGTLFFYARTAGDPSPVMRSIPALVKRLDPNLPVVDLKSMEQQVRENVFLDRFISVLSSAFAVLATLLACVGLYGVLAYTVARRTREIGLRIALGANEARVRSLVFRQMSRMLVIGGIAGLGAAYGLGRLGQSLLFGMEGVDAIVLSMVTALMAAVALGAAYVPALRASRVDPMEALRYE